MTGRRAANRQGALLLEAVVALAAFGVVGLSLLAVAREGLATVKASHARDRESRDAAALVDAVALWPFDELMQRLGEHRQGPFLLALSRPAPALFTVELSDSTGARSLVRTQLFRPKLDASR